MPERDDWLEMLQSVVGQKLEKVERRDVDNATYYRLWFEGGGFFEWHGSTKHPEGSNV